MPGVHFMQSVRDGSLLEAPECGESLPEGPLGEDGRTGLDDVAGGGCCLRRGAATGWDRCRFREPSGGTGAWSESDAIPLWRH